MSGVYSVGFQDSTLSVQSPPCTPNPALRAASALRPLFFLFFFEKVPLFFFLGGRKICHLL